MKASIYVPHLVQSCAEKHPDRIAVISCECELTYSDLNTRAEFLASALRAMGVGPETLVALCAPRGAAFIVGALGIFKSAAAYLPIDPGEPAARIDAMLSDAGVSIVVTLGPVMEKLQNSNCRIIALNQLGELVPPPNSRSEEKGSTVPGDLHNLAYAIYTSGSTGEPKGVEITHVSLSNLVAWHQSAFKVTAADRATCLARVGFDASVWEIWPYLCAGASLHVPEQCKLNDPEALQSWLISQEITITFVPTPLAERLLALPWPRNTRLRIMLTGGDALHIYPSSNLPFTLINNYGPTECTVVATSGTVATTRLSNRLPAIGRPIDNTKIVIFNDHLTRVPDGTAGEMCIGGVGVARGYRNRPDLTAEKFIPDPSDPVGRLFRTGDRALLLPDGQIAFLGRLDDQIKIRGFRIEPSEIVAAVSEHPKISQSAVIAREQSPGDLHLIAYIVPKSENVPTATDLREFLLGRLPDYMVPSTYIKLDTMPLTPNGKIDRAALPAPDASNTIGDAVLNAPQTEIEAIVARTLAPLLGLPAVDVEANFFALGAHSLLGTQLISRLRESLGVELTLRELFDAPSVAELSEIIERELCAKMQAANESEAQQTLHA